MIDAYEGVCRLLEDAFRRTRTYQRFVPRRPSAPRSSVRPISRAGSFGGSPPKALERMQATFVEAQWEHEVRSLLDRFATVCSAEGLWSATASSRRGAAGQASRRQAPVGRVGRCRPCRSASPVPDPDIPPLAATTTCTTTVLRRSATSCETSVVWTQHEEVQPAGPGTPARVLERGDDDGEAIGCIATTFAFDAPFFEEECLARFVGMETNPQEDPLRLPRGAGGSAVASYLGGPGRSTPRSAPRSLRWHLLPVRVRRGGVFHPKLTVLAWERRMRVVIGSCNLTEAGYRRNYEHVSVLDFTPEGTTPKALLGEAIDFVEQVRRLAPGDLAAPEGPQQALRDLLLRVREVTADWVDPRWPRGEPVHARGRPGPPVAPRAAPRAGVGKGRPVGGACAESLLRRTGRRSALRSTRSWR